ncbi:MULTISPECIES: polysaccharide biosynthesis/export family protein [unclassified Burkholderia]|uniref:polysaccharide biosynthesis/export family protein n=1 Tax=unclassified Burkholderia TaxID=2613784 RepID=UPI0021AB133E|nr:MULTISPECIES: polysaccharide biosynthesis/export family protein [unclassified Burkholderia]
MESAANVRPGAARPRGARLLPILSIATLSVALSACALAPGMRMAESPPSSAADARPDGETPHYEIRKIGPDLIRQLKAQAARQQAAQADLLTASPGAYRIGPGDVLQITVWDHPELAAAQGAAAPNAPHAADPVTGFVVDQNGDLAFPFAGRVHVAGLTADAARTRVADALARAYRNPQVTLRVASFRSKQVYIDGEVRAPGNQPVNDVPMTLYEALGRAGGLNPAADQSRMTLVRDGVTHPLDLTQLLRQGRNPADIVLAAAAESADAVLARAEGNRHAGVCVDRAGRRVAARARRRPVGPRRARVARHRACRRVDAVRARSRQLHAPFVERVAAVRDAVRRFRAPGTPGRSVGVRAGRR